MNSYQDSYGRTNIEQARLEAKDERDWKANDLVKQGAHRPICTEISVNWASNDPCRPRVVFKNGRLVNAFNENEDLTDKLDLEGLALEQWLLKVRLVERK